MLQACLVEEFKFFIPPLQGSPETIHHHGADALVICSGGLWKGTEGEFHGNSGH